MYIKNLEHCLAYRSTMYYYCHLPIEKMRKMDKFPKKEKIQGGYFYKIVIL